MIIFLGIAGAGKTEQSKLLAGELNYYRISVGQLLRDNANADLKYVLDKGELIDDEIVIPILEKHIAKVPPGKDYIIDGFPRTLNEAIWITNRPHKDLVVIQIVLTPEEAYERLKTRNRADDNDQAIKKRIYEYEEFIDSILHIFKEKNITIISIDGSRGIQDVHDQIIRRIKTIRRKS